MIEYKERVTSQEPVTKEMRDDLSLAREVALEGQNALEDLSEEVNTLSKDLSQKADLQTIVNTFENFQHLIANRATKEDLKKSISDMLGVANKIQSQVCDMSVFSISDSGYVDIKEIGTCPIHKGDNGSSPSMNIPLEFQKKQVRLTLRSDYDALKRRVDNLTTQLSKLKAETQVTPITNANLRRSGSILYPKYGDWILTSDAEDQYMSFGGLKAEIGRSIYIQTRKRVYLYSNNHNFFGLSAAGNGLSSNQWLESKTTYRFVRKDATTWLVTSSSSPYPWV